jgi:hypothetical protein
MGSGAEIGLATLETALEPVPPIMGRGRGARS